MLKNVFWVHQYYWYSKNRERGLGVLFEHCGEVHEMNNTLCLPFGIKRPYSRFRLNSPSRHNSDTSNTCTACPFRVPWPQNSKYFQGPGLRKRWHFGSSLLFPSFSLLSPQSRRCGSRAHRSLQRSLNAKTDPFNKAGEFFSRFLFQLGSRLPA